MNSPPDCEPDQLCDCDFCQYVIYVMQPDRLSGYFRYDVTLTNNPDKHMTCMCALQWPLLTLLLYLPSAIGAFAQAQNQPAVARVPTDTIGADRTFELPLIIEVLRPNDIGILDDAVKDERLYYINAGKEVTIYRGDTLNVYRDKKLHASLPGVRVFIGIMTIEESYNGSSMGHFTPSEKIGLPVIKFKVPIEGDKVVPRLAIDSSVLFQPGAFSLTASAGAEFDKVASFVRNFSPSKLVIEGHTDSDGDDKTNQILSERRADAVGKFLVDGYPFITPEMIEVRGYGETQPIVPNDTPENKKLNRRIEAIVWE